LQNTSNRLSGIPPGETELIFSKSGYISKELSLNLKPGEVRDIDLKLEPEPLTIIFQWMLILCNVCGCVLFPGMIVYFYLRWKSYGKDVGRKQTIVPVYHPPKEVRPYLLGSLKDEKVDLVDITATLIDVAYRGFIKIREFGAKSIKGIKIKGADFEFIKQKDFKSLTPPEQKILSEIFSGKKRISTTSLKKQLLQQSSSH